MFKIVLKRADTKAILIPLLRKEINMQEKLLKCPFCGREDITVSRSFIDPLTPDSLPDEVFVGCIRCDIGYIGESEEEAIEAWNRRVK